MKNNNLSRQSLNQLIVHNQNKLLDILSEHAVMEVDSITNIADRVKARALTVFVNELEWLGKMMLVDDGTAQTTESFDNDAENVKIINDNFFDLIDE